MTDIGHNGGPPLNRGKSGWVAVSRGMREHWLVGFGQPVKAMNPDRGSLSRAEAWIDLIMECRYEAGFVMNGGRKMSLQPGQLVGAVSYLAHRWNWSPQTVRTWLDKLEDDGMIDRNQPGVSTGNNKQAGKQASVISVCNFDIYQVSDDGDATPEQQANNKQATSNQQASNNNNKDNKGTREQDSPPTPKGGREPKSKKSPFSQTEIASTDAAFEVWNSVAANLGLPVVKSTTDSRRRRLASRLADIGGLDNFKLALSAIPSVPFLMGKVPPRPGQDPFKLDIERLMQTDGNLGDVLAKLIDKACEQPPSAAGLMWWQDAEKVAAITDDQWREMISQFAGKTWPPDKLGPAPGSKRCVVPSHIIDELKLTERYDANGISREPH